jgi:agmatinase
MGNSEKSRTNSCLFFAAGKRIICHGRRTSGLTAVIKAYHRFFQDLVVIQLDAHADLREIIWGRKCPMQQLCGRLLNYGRKKEYFTGYPLRYREELEYAEK